MSLNRQGKSQRIPASRHRDEIILFIIALLIYVFLAVRFRFVIDDAYISFRYAQNWAMGEGIRFNLGEPLPVEGYSNFLWVAVCALLEQLRAEIKFWPLFVSLMCGAVLLWMVFTTLHRQLKVSLPASFIAVLFLACSPPFALWSTSGLETMPFSLLMFATFKQLMLRKEAPEPVTAGFLGIALALIRVEGIFWGLIFAVLALVKERLSRHRNFRPIFIYAAILVIGYAIYWLWRLTYYQAFFPNTVYAKVAISPATLKRGLHYVLAQNLTFIPMLLILPGALVALHKRFSPFGLPVAVIAIGVTVYAIVVSGDFMPMARLLVAGLPFVAVLYAWLFEYLSGNSTNRRIITMVSALLIILAGLLPAWDIHLIPGSIRQKFSFTFYGQPYQSEYQQYIDQKNTTMKWELQGRHLKLYAKPGDSLVCGGIGARGYYSGLYIYDQHGLINRVVSARKVSGHLIAPGHDKRVGVEFFLDEKPTILFVEIILESKLQRYIEDCSKGVLPDRYIADFMRIPDNHVKGEPQYLFVVRHIDDNISTADAWVKVKDAVRETLGK